MILFFLLFSTLTFAGTSRAPAVLETLCDLNVADTGKPLIEIHQEQCKRVHQCMNSAADNEMSALKKLEALACKGELLPVTTSIPKLEVNKAELNDNSRREKQMNEESSLDTKTPSEKEK